MYVIMLGAPGTGKGTIGNDICSEFGFEHVATGDIFREEIKNKTEYGIEAEKYIKDGNLVPDDLTLKIVEEKLKKVENGVLDGFPRTINQAEKLKEFLKSNNNNIIAVVELIVPDEDLIKRTSSRVICSNKNCKTSYNTMFLKPKVEGICDKCGAELVRRADDEPETLKERLSVYHNTTEKLIEYYKKEDLLVPIDIDIYDPETREKTSAKAIEGVRERIK